MGEKAIRETYLAGPVMEEDSAIMPSVAVQKHAEKHESSCSGPGGPYQVCPLMTCLLYYLDDKTLMNKTWDKQVHMGFT